MPHYMATDMTSSPNHALHLHNGHSTALLSGIGVQGYDPLLTLIVALCGAPVLSTQLKAKSLHTNDT